MAAKHFMTRTAVAVCGGILLASQAGAAPRLVGAKSPECLDTLAVAKVAFYSKAFRLSDAVVLPKGGRVAVAAQSETGDISGGLGIVADPAIFKILPPTSSPPSAPGFNRAPVYWQIAVTGRVRWVMVDEPFNWKGDWYKLYAVDPSLAETAFKPLDRDDPRIVLDNKWIPPLMLRNLKSGVVWAVDSGSGAIGVWDVYAAGKDGVKESCRIVTQPKVRTAFDLLPPAVRALARDLDATLGDGMDEGTLQPTARMRYEVAQAWTNLAVRPWALVADGVWPYNTRRDADAGLKRWSYGAASFRALYKRIQGEYPAAVDELAALYVARFGKTPDAARALAIHNIDIAYRDHFIFPQSFIHPAKTKP